MDRLFELMPLRHAHLPEHEGERRGITSDSVVDQGCESWEHATSYWATLFGLLEFWDWLPA